jgi:hypothetical protein
VTRKRHTDGALPEDLRRRVQTALFKQDLLPSSEVFVRTLTRITRHGAEYRTQLLRGGAWRRGLASSELGSSSALARVLGFGAAMTRFSIAWIPMSAMHRRSITRLGALSNVIVSLYDQLADALGERDLLSRAALVGVLGGSGSSRRRAAEGSAYSVMIGNAVETYARMLHELPYCEERPTVCRSVISTIVKLYDAESATLGRLGRNVALQERIASATGMLSHEVMGLPAWLAADRLDRNAMSRHRRWLRSVGELHGWIDDVVDIKEDEEHGYPNRVLLRLRAAGVRRTRAALGSVIREIARLGLSVRDHWSIRAAGVPHHARSLDEFKTCLTSWLGGPRFHSF